MKHFPLRIRKRFSLRVIKKARAVLQPAKAAERPDHGRGLVCVMSCGACIHHCPMHCPANPACFIGGFPDIYSSWYALNSNVCIEGSIHASPNESFLLNNSQESVFRELLSSNLTHCKVGPTRTSPQALSKTQPKESRTTSGTSRRQRRFGSEAGGTAVSILFARWLA